MNFQSLFKINRPVVIGMIHLRGLPGAPTHDAKKGLHAVIDAALADVENLSKVDALMVENFGDHPFFPGGVPALTVSAMTRVVCEIRRVCKLPLGINVLRNDGASALAIAHTCDAQFIRVNVLTGARVTDQGLIQGNAHELLRLRSSLGSNVAILADVDVKHSVALAPRPLEDEVQDTVLRGMADAIVVSGSHTGSPTHPDKVSLVRKASAGVPVLIGSGAREDNLEDYLGIASGFIVGTSIKATADVWSPVSASKVEALMKKVNAMQWTHKTNP